MQQHRCSCEESTRFRCPYRIKQCYQYVVAMPPLSRCQLRCGQMYKKVTSSTQVILEAAEWNLRLKRGGLSADESREYLRWMEVPLHAQELGRTCIIDALLSRDQLKRTDVVPDNVIDFDSYCPPVQPKKERERHVPQAVSICNSYLANFCKKNTGAKIVLVSAGLVALLLSKWMGGSSVLSAIACLLALGLILSKEAILRYRVRRGLFGSTDAEVRDLLGFIIEDCSSEDFTDDDGHRRPVFDAHSSDSDLAAGVLPRGATTT